MKALKLSPFIEAKGDLCAYLTRFKRACVAFDIKPEHRSAQLAGLLQRQSMEVCHRLPDGDIDKYKINGVLMLNVKRFQLTEGDTRRN